MESTSDAFLGVIQRLRDVGALPFALALGVTLIAIPLLRRLAVARDLYDRPDAGLKPHARPVPYLGGVGIWIGWLAAMLAGIVLVQEARGGSDLHWKTASIVVGGSLLMLVGLVDDVRHVPPKLRLLIQVMVAGLLVYAGIGRGVWQSLSQAFGETAQGQSFGDLAGVCLNALFVVLVLAGATNATNLIDGLDGLCAGIVGIAAIGFLAIALFAGDPGSDRTALTFVLCAGLLGTCAAFLKYNFAPATLFMGDSGTLLLGFNVAVIMILLCEQAGWPGLVGALLVFGFPIFDTALAITRRRRHRKPLFIGDRSHFYDQLRDRGGSVRGTVLLCYAIGVSCAVLGCLVVMVPTPWIFAIVVAAVTIAALSCWRFGLLKVDDTAARSNWEPPPSSG